MSTQHSMNKNGEGFNLPLKWKPGADLTSKMLLSDPKIMNLIVHSLIDGDVPPNSYTVAQTEWADAKGLSTLYVSQNTSNDKLIPILITIQEEVDQNAMLETIEHSSSVYENFKALPIVLIISNKSSSSLKNNGEFSVIDNSFLMQCESKFWANKCFLFLRGDLVNGSMDNTPISALFTVCQFLSDPNKLLTL